MYSRPSQYKKYGHYAEKTPIKNKENPFYEFTSMEDKTEKITKNNGKLIVVDIYATWCGPCKEIVPQLVDLANKYKDRVVFFKENVEADLCPAGTVTAVPAFHFFYNGQYIPDNNVVGADISELEKNINILLEKI